MDVKMDVSSLVRVYHLIDRAGYLA